ncbi:MAG TPA: hypothetical protein DCF43_10145 [Pseudomonas sp.]|nr:hypothetical protein [Pseudomonas sp.]
MTLGIMVAERLEAVSMGGFDISTISKEAFNIYQDPDFSLTKDLDVVLLSLIAIDEGPEFEITEEEFQDLLSEIRQM